MKSTFTLENLGCANCAAKMETKINALPEVESASISFATKQLQVYATEITDVLLESIQNICTSVESGVIITNHASHHHIEHQHHCHDCHEHHSEGISTEKKELFQVLFGALLFLIGVIVHKILPESANMPLPLIITFLVAYIILGGGILLQAGKNILHGKIFDENFLMAVATIGAIAIGDYPEAVGVMLFFSIGELFEHHAVEKSRKSIMDAVDMRPEVVTLISNGVMKEIPAADAKMGDYIQVRPGDRIPLDGKIIDGESRIDTSPVTGEPVPIHVQKGDVVVSGCVNTSGLLTIIVEKELKDSMVSKILDAVENAAANKPKLDRFITRFARIYTPIVVFSALAVAIIPSLITHNWSYWIYTALTFLVISCPCALVLSVPLAFFSGIGLGSKQGILFKGGSALEALSTVEAVIMDKTGTITKGNFDVQKIETSMDEQQFLTLVASVERSSSHPIAESIIRYANEKGLTLQTPDSVTEIAGKGILASLNGHTILCGTRDLLSSNEIAIPDYAHSFGTEIFCAKDNLYLGSLYLADTIKENAATAIFSCKKQGLYTIMLTGDNEETANYVGDAVNIDEIHCQLLPEEKLTKLNAARAQHGSIMFVGDGINDAPVLAGADVGAAMGSGSDSAIDAADVVFMTSDMQAIPDALAIAKQSTKTAKANIAFALIVKALVLIFGLFGIANMWFAVFADSGVAMICILNAVRILQSKSNH